MFKITRHVFFAFRWESEKFRINEIRNQSKILGATSVKYWDNSLNEKSYATNSEYIKRKIRDGLEGTSVTVILVTSTTHKSDYVKYEYEKSVERGNGILQLDVSNLKDINGNKEKFSEWLPYVSKGLKKEWFSKCPLGDWIEDAYKKK